MPSANVSTPPAGGGSPCNIRDAAAYELTSTPITSMFGWIAAAATATPDTNPPPPIGTSKTSRSGAAASISSAIVPLAGDHRCVVVGRYVAIAVFGDQLVELGPGLCEGRPMLHHGCTERFGVDDLVERRRFRHHDRGPQPKPAGVVGNPLRMVSCRQGDQPTLSFLGRERPEVIGSTTIFERTGELQVLELHVNIRADHRRQRGRPTHRRRHDVASDHLRSAANVVNGNCHAATLTQRRPSAGHGERSRKWTAVAPCQHTGSRSGQPPSGRRKDLSDGELLLVQPHAVAPPARRLPREAPLGVGGHRPKAVRPRKSQRGVPHLHGPVGVRRRARLRRNRRQTNTTQTATESCRRQT